MGRRGRKPGAAKSAKAQGGRTQRDEYASWLALVPSDKRAEIAKFVRKSNIKEFDDLVSLSTKIMAALVEGRIAPSIAAELRAWHELNFTILAAKNTADGTPQGAYTDVITALIAVKREAKQLRGAYIEPEEIAMESPIEIGDQPPPMASRGLLSETLVIGSDEAKAEFFAQKRRAGEK